MNAKRTRSNYEIIHEKSVSDSNSNVGCLPLLVLMLFAVVIILVTLK